MAWRGPAVRTVGLACHRRAQPRPTCRLRREDSAPSRGHSCSGPHDLSRGRRHHTGTNDHRYRPVNATHFQCRRRRQHVQTGTGHTRRSRQCGYPFGPWTRTARRRRDGMLVRRSRGVGLRVDLSRKHRDRRAAGAHAASEHLRARRKLDRSGGLRVARASRHPRVRRLGIPSQPRNVRSRPAPLDSANSIRLACCRCDLARRDGRLGLSDRGRCRRTRARRMSGRSSTQPSAPPCYRRAITLKCRTWLHLRRGLCATSAGVRGWCGLRLLGLRGRVRRSWRARR
jgi:hypothetical protein